MQNERGGETHLSHEDLHAVAKQLVEENELKAGCERIESGAGVRLYLTRSMIIEVLHGISNVHVLLILHMC